MCQVSFLKGILYQNFVWILSPLYSHAQPVISVRFRSNQTDIGPTQPPIQWEPCKSKVATIEGENLPLSVAEANNAWNCTSILPYIFML